MASPSSQMVGWLKAAGEPSRLRLLVLCGQRDLSVSDLAEALGQSEPRVSRHLRILSEAGLVERSRAGQWVQYRLATHPAAASFIQGVLGQLDRRDPQLKRDLDRALARPEDGQRSEIGSESRLGRALRDFIEADEANITGKPPGGALVVGVDHLELLECAASLASQCTAIARSRRAAQGARAFAERHGFNCRVLLAGTPDALTSRDIERAGNSFEVVVLDHLARDEAEFIRALEGGRRALSPTGRIWLFERYESLEVSRDKVVEHPLARLRRLLAEAGLSCERLSPVEADGEHVLAAVAAPAANRERPTLRRA